MNTLPSDSTPTTDQLGQEAQDEPIKKRNRELRQQVDLCKSYRNKLARNWHINIDFRRGKPFSTQTDQDRINVNIDWAVTKAKQASLFSQVPQIRISHPPQTSAPYTFSFQQKVNDTLVEAGIESCMEEVLPDCINAAGIGIAIVAREAITEEITIPATDLSLYPPDAVSQIMATQMLPDGTPLQMTTIPKVVDQRYTVTRVSPIDFLWPMNFNGSDFDHAPWIGRTGRITWAEAQKRFNLRDEDKNKYVGDNRNTFFENLTYDTQKDKVDSHNTVVFDEIFYKEFQFDASATSFSTIHHLIFLGKEQDPVVDEPWRGQRTNESNVLIGCLRYPIRVLTLTYLTDEAIPPSDSAIIRPQVNELNESRTQIILQRKHSLPVRWFDVNRVDPTVQTALMRGVWQSLVPVQGVGSNAIGEIQRATMPQENFLFDKIAKADINDLTQIGNPISGTDITTDEMGASQSNLQTRISKERARVGRFITGIAEILGGLIALYEDPTSFGQGFDAGVSRTLSYSILADSTVLLDSNQKLQRLIQFINFTAKSGWVSLEPVLKEVATLSGLDANLVIQAPQPKAPDEPNISLRLTGVEDLMNPLTLAFLLKSGQAPDNGLIDQAKALIAEAVAPPPGLPPGVQPMPNGTIMTPQMMQAQGLMQPGPNGQPPALPSPPIQPGSPSGMPVTPPSPPPPGVGQAHPDWSTMSRINKRSDEESS